MDHSPNKSEKVDADQIDIDLIQAIFWGLTDRNKQSILEVKPANYHLWGKEKEILANSPTLRNLVISNRLERVNNYRATFHDVLTELGLDYKVEKIPGNKPGLIGVMYNIQSIPRWSFGHFDETEHGAVSYAAKKGLSFFIEMAK